MMWTKKDARRARPNTFKLVDLAEQGALDWEILARDLIGWMSDDEVGEFARANDLLQGE